MEVRWDVFLIIAGCALVTFLPRVLPLMVLSRMQLPEWGVRWLHYVPISVMAALVGQELFLHEGKLAPLLTNVELMAAIPTFLVAIWTRSLLGTVVVGMASIMVLRYLFSIL
ncbi:MULTISPECIES: AzlD domain-containing protein [Brevibacillus]|jgi:branched-subunit amino acid transport protein|uniref:Branched-chain amino acid ABC transporter n=1 Tax=Brevibacillus parabrevis TaxID=54914 RepID=A0A4Y3PQV3_BREPA|nr:MULTISPECIES: AzlD domain-containing protein [Brevibacillus]MBU8712535.1 AzlD domain-containing protein [Brevibacillus parabrevis]MDH6353476.1 branched-subunit amino acid transport protein [Brevibacillus sp. 1238]MDR5000152.1 AzlD domain-containing protein [Brevibacillus parabrevis]MED2256855.1 AzlD domain-containing protein [Brevibacillus parabrevis]NRQ56925.1 AzlD domain-containing protein [Brevibacillus sp. HD1.4A]